MQPDLDLTQLSPAALDEWLGECEREDVLADWGKLRSRLPALVRYVRTMREALIKHRDQKGDDRCWLDDLELYRVIGGVTDNTLPPKEKFLANCSRYYDNRCQAGEWKSYQEVLAQRATLAARVAELERALRSVEDMFTHEQHCPAPMGGEPGDCRCNRKRFFGTIDAALAGGKETT